MCGKRTDDHSRGTRGTCGTNGGQAEAARLSANDRQTDNSSSPVRFSKLARQALAATTTCKACGKAGCCICCFIFSTTKIKHLSSLFISFIKLFSNFKRLISNCKPILSFTDILQHYTQCGVLLFCSSKSILHTQFGILSIE